MILVFSFEPGNLEGYCQPKSQVQVQVEVEVQVQVRSFLFKKIFSGTFYVVPRKQGRRRTFDSRMNLVSPWEVWVATVVCRDEDVRVKLLSDRSPQK